MLPRNETTPIPHYTLPFKVFLQQNSRKPDRTADHASHGFNPAGTAFTSR